MGSQFPPPGKKARVPDVPVMFIKPQSSITGPGAVINVPRLAKEEETDYEVEIGCVLGKQVKRDCPLAEAETYVLGWVVANDVSLAIAERGGTVLES